MKIRCTVAANVNQNIQIEGAGNFLNADDLIFGGEEGADQRAPFVFLSFNLACKT